LALHGLAELQSLRSDSSAEIYLARRVDTDQRVAVKVGRLSGEDPVGHEQFTNECAALTMLRGEPHVVAYVDSGVLQSGRPFVVIEYWERTLAAELTKEGGRLPLRRAIEVGVHLATGLRAVHAHGLVHGDMSPDNVLVDKQDGVILADFGMSTTTRPDQKSALGFTPPYAAPECVDTGVINATTDVYGLGATLYLLITGRPPAGRKDHRALVRAVKAGPERAAGGPAINRMIDTITSMLDADPAARPDSETVLDVLLATRRDTVYRPVKPVPERFFSDRVMTGLGRKAVVAGVVVLAVLVAVMYLTASNSSTGAATPLVALHSGKCVTITGDLVAAGARTEQQRCDRKTGQSWQLERLPHGARQPAGMHIVAADSRLCLTHSEEPLGGTQMGELLPCDPDSDAQDWRFLGTNQKQDGYIYGQLINMRRGSCLDVYGATTADAAPVALFTCGDTQHHNQLFGIAPESLPPPN
jgi:hypothetical protein